VTDVDTDGTTDLGDSITWSFAVTNSGTTSVTGVGITDPKAGTVTCAVTSLPPGGSTTCSSSAHIVSQAEVDAGTVSNTATAHGVSAGRPVVSGPSSTDTPVTQDAALSAVKHATVHDLNGDGKTGKGDTITWSVTVTNDGSVTVHAVVITDPKAGPMTCLVSSLAPGAATTCTATVNYTITQPDVDAGQVDNTATATASDPTGTPVTSPPASVTTPVVSSSALSLIKAASTFDVTGDSVLGVGDTISWRFDLSNTGSATLSGLSVSDPIAGAVTCPVTTLAPGGSTTCTAASVHTVTQVDVDLGDVANTATAAAVDPAGAAVDSLPSSTDTALDQLAALRLVKHGVATDVNHDGITDARDTILWSFDVTNTGRVTLDAVTVTDTIAGPVTCLVTTLAVGDSTVCTSTHHYVITDADAAAGAVHNVATAVGQCACRAAVKAVKAAAVVATQKHATPPQTHPSHPSDPADPPHRADPADPIVPGLPFTGAMGIAWAIRGGLMALAVGAFLLVVTRRRKDEGEMGPETS
ncbi:MAG: hypothetical protein M3P23_10545, partial [Actinomycetota bacterium]|nr:hypothetical protein [Actinomycetota bacterium]